MTIDDYIEERNKIQIQAESLESGDEIWKRLGVANRHIERVINGTLPLTPGLEKEIRSCLDNSREALKRIESQP